MGSELRRRSASPWWGDRASQGASCFTTPVIYLYFDRLALRFQPGARSARRDARRMPARRRRKHVSP